MGSSTWLEHFIHLMPPALRDSDWMQKADLQNSDWYHDHIPEAFAVYRLNEALDTVDKVAKYLRSKNIFVFSFVRHPFHRYICQNYKLKFGKS